MAGDNPTLDPEATEHQDNQARFVIDVLARHWVMIVAVTLVAGAGAAFLGKILQVETRTYGAQAELIVRPSFWQSPIMADVGSNVFGPTTPSSLLAALDTQELIRDASKALVQGDVAGGLLGADIVSDEEIELRAIHLQALIRFEAIDAENLLRVSTTSPVSAKDAGRLADLTIRVLVEHTQRRRLENQEDAYLLVKQQLEQLRSQLDVAENEQWIFREEMGFQTHAQVWSDMERKNAELLEAIATKEEIFAKLDEIDAALIENAHDLPDALGNVTESVVRKLLADLDGLRQEQIELNVVWKPGYPELVRLNDELAEKKQAVLLAIGELNSGASAGSNLWERRQGLYRQKVDLNAQLIALDIRRASLERMLKEQVAGLPELADKSFVYEQLLHEAQSVRTQFDRMLAKEFDIKTALARGSGTVERRGAVMGLSPIRRGGTSMVANFGIGAIIGLAISFGFALILESTDTSIQSLDDVARHLDLEVIGMIPEMKFGKRGRSRRRRGAYVVSTSEDDVDACIVTQRDPKSPVSEAYRSLRTNFQFATLKAKPKTVMITSSVPAEGKTTTAANFAVTMADRGIRVLIVDTDLRRPNVHRVLKMDRGPGLADVLREQIPVQEVIRPTQTENLWLISSGRVPPNPSELIGSEAMADLMKELGGMFDLVVCDAPSALVVTDPVLLATHVDAVVLVVAAARARRETIQRAKKLIEMANSNIAGVVLNGLEASTRHYYYYYYYYDDGAHGGRRKWFHTAGE